MAFRDGPLQDGRTPLVWAAIGSTVVAVIIAVVLLLADRREAMARTGDYGAARSEFDQLAAPIMGVLSAPVRLLTDASTDVRGYFFAVSENRRLRTRLKEMERWRDAAIALKNVNDRYEQLLKLRTEPPIPMVAARVIADARGPFSNARLADAGVDQGVRNGQPVISDHGVVGRVVGAGPDVSRVLLLTDVDSRAPVLVDRSNARAILTGDGGPNPRLEYVRGAQALKEGDILLTSGDGGVFPRGLPVGVAAKDLRGVWRARLYADRQALDYVRILTYVDFGELRAASLAATEAPPRLDPTQQAQLQQALAQRAQGPQMPTPLASSGAAASAGGPTRPRAAPKPPSASRSPPPRRSNGAAFARRVGRSGPSVGSPRRRAPIQPASRPGDSDTPPRSPSHAAHHDALVPARRPGLTAASNATRSPRVRSGPPKPKPTATRANAAPAGETTEQRERAAAPARADERRQATGLARPCARSQTLRAVNDVPRRSGASAPSMARSCRRWPRWSPPSSWPPPCAILGLGASGARHPGGAGLQPGPSSDPSVLAPAPADRQSGLFLDLFCGRADSGLWSTALLDRLWAGVRRKRTLMVGQSSAGARRAGTSP